MNTQANLPSDLIDLLSEFENTKVEYLLVGGHAVALHGFPRFTKDADLWVRDEPNNLDRVRRAVVGKDELIGLKRASGRPQDLLDAANLEKR